MFRRYLKNPRIIIIAFLAVLFLLLGLTTNLLTDWLWFTSFNYQSTFWIMLLSSWVTRLAAGLLLFLFFFVNLLITVKAVRDHLADNVKYMDEESIPIRDYLLEKFITTKRLILLFFAVSAFLALILSSIAATQWPLVQRFLHTVPFNIKDPIFNSDISFYIFKLPFYKLLYYLLTTATVVSAIAVGIVYFMMLPRGIFSLNFKRFKQPHIHLTILLALFFILKAWDYRLRAYELLLSPRGITFGAGYTDIHAQLPAYNILAVISLIAALVLVVSIFVKVRKLIIGAVGLLIISSVLLGIVYPAFIEKFRVEPNQFAMEEEYLKYNITFTQKAYNLDAIEEKEFAASKELPANNLSETYPATINNIRLWDWRPLRQTYNQLQGLRPYYIFNNVDIDRYVIDGEYRQVMLAGRELDQEKLQERAKTWQNYKLRYTHGYGLVMSPVNAVTPEGLPEFFISDIPPVASVDLEVKRPEIYFGELTDNYVIVNNKSMEFDYPSGDDNIYNNYKGSGGIKLDSIFKKILFAYKFKDLKILLSTEITGESRMLFDRDVMTMVHKTAPFLRYDRDPYLVLSEGKLFWIIDAYTVSSRYPYAEPTPGWGNYVRNSVKVVIDAYEGAMNFYISDPKDPIINSYSQIFPRLFKSLEEMPEDLKLHIRYPEDLFLLQSNMYTIYHMENPRVFYNKEDAWNIPEEIYAGQSQTMEPYYVIMQIPGESEAEYVLMLPFTPFKKQNMIAWLAARNDGENYGKLLLFKFPKNKHVYGPAQIEARIDQDSEISQQLTLWNQRGSQVLRGNLLVVPIGESILYVEPLFLQAEQSNLPELKRVIVGFGNEIVMAETLEEGLRELFVRDEEPAPVEPEPTEGEEDEREEEIDDVQQLPLDELIYEANRAFEEARERAREGDWEGYGRSLERLENILQQLAGQVKQNE